MHAEIQELRANAADASKLRQLEKDLKRIQDRQKSDETAVGEGSQALARRWRCFLPRHAMGAWAASRYPSGFRATSPRSKGKWGCSASALRRRTREERGAMTKY